MGALRLMVYDKTCTGSGFAPGLTHSWILGGALYGALGRIDHFQGVDSWEEAFDWLGSVGGDRPIREVQYWGHGKWGNAFIAGQAFNRAALKPDHPLFGRLLRVQRRLTGQDALFWFRTCETYGGVVGQRFATEFTHFLDCQTAGHTFIIGPWQSGLCVLKPGQEPWWSPDEGILEGDRDAPERAAWSTPFAPRTISCLRGDIPAAISALERAR